VLEWLDRVAVALLDHTKTPEHQEAVRKSGQKNVSGLSATEQETRAAKRTAQLNMRIAEKLSKEYDTGVRDNCHPWQWNLIQDYRSGLLQETRAAAKRRSRADTMCRTPSLARGSATEQTIH